MTLPRVSCQENSLEPGTQDLPPGSDPHAAPSGMIEEPVSTRVTEAILDTPRPSNI